MTTSASPAWRRNRSSIHAYHLAEHHGTPLGLAPSPNLFLAAAIQRAIAAVLQGRTTLLITHRLSQIRRADRIVVLHRGRVVDQGTHPELLDRCALYRRIFARHEGS